MAKGLLFSVILNFTAPLEIKKAINDTHAM